MLCHLGDCRRGQSCARQGAVRHAGAFAQSNLCLSPSLLPIPQHTESRAARGSIQATAASTKAQFDKFVLDKAEEKAAFDAVLEQTAAEASQQKAIADKALVDFGELQVRSPACGVAGWTRWLMDGGTLVDGVRP
jgi:hypothetical protein